MPKSFSISDGKAGGNVAGGPNLEGFIVEVKNYQDGLGRSVQERIVVQGEAPPDFHPFIGVGKVALQIATPQGPQVMQDTFRFSIDGVKTIGDAFRMYEDFRTRGEATYKAQIEKQLAKANEPQLQVASAGDLSRLPAVRPRA